MNSGIIIVAVVVSLLVGFFIGFFIQKQVYIFEIKKLILILDTIMRGNYKPDFSCFKEGEISLLTNQLELVVKRTEHIVNELKREKISVKNSIADISHQLKTPLAGLLSYLDLLEQNEENLNKKEQLDNCIYLTERMNDLIRTMLELAKLEADAIELRFLNHNCKAMVENAVFAAKSSRPNSNVNFKFEIDNDLEIRCDSKWFGQALVNIIVNAIDYSKTDGCIHIIAKQNGGVITLKVNDQGGGIAENELHKIFNRFYRAANSPKGGFGIGLSMAESIIKLHKGNIRAINENDGLSMVISLPLLCCAENI